MAIKILLDHSNELYYYIIRTNVLWGFVTIKRIGLIKTEDLYMSINKEDRKSARSSDASNTKQFGKGAIMKLGSTASMVVEAIPTGSISLDIATRNGGIPREGLLKSLDLNPQEKQPWRYISLLKRKDGWKSCIY